MNPIATCPRFDAHRHTNAEHEAFLAEVLSVFASEYAALHESPTMRETAREVYTVVLRMETPLDFCVHMALLSHTRDGDADFLAMAMTFVGKWYDADERAAARAMGVSPDALRSIHWGDDPATQRAGRALFARLRAGIAPDDIEAAAAAAYGHGWKELHLFRADRLLAA